MNRFLVLCCLLALKLASFGAGTGKPNIVFILADDLGYGEVGCYGQKLIQTPNIDQLAANGIRFTQFYAGSTVCAPSRSVLMTGQHLGHTTVRGNAGAGGNFAAQMLKPDDVTVAEVLKDAGYTTALIGKWGLGLHDDGHPNRQGFDYFFGYLSQHHAHNQFPDHLWRNFEKVPLKNDIHPIGPFGAGYSTNRLQFAGDLFAEEALQFLDKSKDKPFFLYLSLVVPHGNNERTRALKDGAEVPDYGIYKDKDWSNPTKGHAATITRMDRDVGRLIAKLKQLGIERNTLVIFTSDNGPHKESNHDSELFNPNGPFSGYKRSLTDGGIRVPFIASWPGRIERGATSDHVGYFGDLMATAAELAKMEPPSNIDSISLVPTLLGKGKQKKHDYLYWEFHEGGSKQAVLLRGRWKGIRLDAPEGPVQLFDLKNDLAEKKDIASTRPKILARIEKIMETAREDNPHWQFR